MMGTWSMTVLLWGHVEYYVYLRILLEEWRDVQACRETSTQPDTFKALSLVECGVTMEVLQTVVLMAEQTPLPFMT